VSREASARYDPSDVESRWTQWIFIQLFNAGLAVRREYPALWCPSCLTVLAFEQVEGDRCERCDSRVTTKLMKQWFLPDHRIRG
jgi:leucyl-tRNA synthetase